MIAGSMVSVTESHDGVVALPASKSMSEQMVTLKPPSY